MLEELFIFIDIILFYFQWMICTVLCILCMMTRMLEKQTVFFSLQLLLRVSTFIYIFINKSGLFEWKRTWAGFCRLFIPVLQIQLSWWEGSDPINRFFYRRIFVPSSSQDVIFAFVLSEFKREVIVGFDGIGGIVDHHCLYFLFINWYNSNLTKKNVYISKQAVISYLNIWGFIVEKIIHILFISVRE